MEGSIRKHACPIFERCPIFINNVFHNELIGQTYKNLYCITRDNQHKSCKRFLFLNKYNTSPPDSVYPNSKLSLDEIAKRMGIQDSDCKTD